MCAFVPVMLAMTAASTALSAAGSIMQGRQADKAGRYQQMEYARQAEADQTASGFEATREFEKNRRLQAAGIVQTAGSGLALTGSPIEALSANAVENQLDIDAIRFGSQMRQNTLNMQGHLARYKGQTAKQAGYLGAATTVLSGATSMASMFDPLRSVKLGGPAAGLT